MSTKSGSPRTFTAGTDLNAFVRVKVSGATVILAGDEEKCHGVTIEKALSGENVAVDLINAGGTKKVKAAGAIAAGAPYYGAANGMVEAAGTTSRGIAIDAALAAGDVIEILPD